MAALAHLYRLFTRQRLFAALNVAGLALGVAVFLVLRGGSGNLDTLLSGVSA